MAGISTRSRDIQHSDVLKGYSGREFIASCVLKASDVHAAGTDEQQTVTITGTPTGGNYTLTFDGVTSANIAYNATAAAIEDALEAMSSIGAGNVRATGGPHPGTAVVVTFINELGRSDQPQMTANSAGLTGGTSPTVAVTTTTAGDANDAGVLRLIEGTILTKVPGDTDKMRKFTAASGEAIEGILGMDVEFIDRTSASDKDAPLFVHNCVFDSSKIVDYATHTAALATWAETHASQFRA